MNPKRKKIASLTILVFAIIPLLLMFQNCGQIQQGDMASPTETGNLNDTNARETFTQVSTGFSNTCGLTASKKVYCWGMAHGANSLSSNPTHINSLPPAEQIGTGWQHTCALTSSGEVYCWGGNMYGQIGNGLAGNSVYSLSPELVSGLSHAVSISAGQTHSCAVTNSGQAYCWGQNYHGQLGNNSITDSPVPVLVSHINNIRHISTGIGHT